MTTRLTERFPAAVNSGESFLDRAAYLDVLCARLARPAVAEAMAAEPQQPSEIHLDQPAAGFDTLPATGIELQSKENY